jgi:outer membrane protein OmpA-like peptidoglycan-associated protein
VTVRFDFDVDEEGFVSERAIPDRNTSVPSQYPQVMRGAERLYTLFFQSGSSNLEGLALDNIDRIVQQMAEPEFRDATVFLVGHADSAGTHQANLYRKRRTGSPGSPSTNRPPLR